MSHNVSQHVISTSGETLLCMELALTGRWSYCTSLFTVIFAV